MTTKLTINRFRSRAPDPVTPLAPRQDAEDGSTLFEPPEDGFTESNYLPENDAASPSSEKTSDNADSPHEEENEIAAIRKEGLTIRQRRLARRLAQKYNLPARSDFDAVRLLRKAGINPFQRANILDFTDDENNEPPQNHPLAKIDLEKQTLPQSVNQAPVPSTKVNLDRNSEDEILRIQNDLVRRRRIKSFFLSLRLMFFVGLPTLIMGYYFYEAATPFYAVNTEFVIQQAGSPATPSASGLSSALLGALSDSASVQGYLQSREAMDRLDKDKGFRAHFSAPNIDPLQQVKPDATQEDLYKVYQKRVKVSYDPTEGIIKMEVQAADPQTGVEFSNALIHYAEQQIDDLTQRLREDQMKTAREIYREAEEKMLVSQRKIVELQEKFKTLSSDMEVTLITSQISSLEGQLTADRLSLAQMESNPSPNQARMDPLKRRIATMEKQVAEMRVRLTEDSQSGESLAKVQSELVVAKADVVTRQEILSQSLQAMEMSRIEANRQVRYLSVSVPPFAPDEAAYPRAFENTIVTMLVFAGIYLMISMTVAILREQVSA